MSRVEVKFCEYVVVRTMIIMKDYDQYHELAAPDQKRHVGLKHVG